MSTDRDLEYMRIALREARKGAGMTHPNPMVGAVLVKNGIIVGKGFHKGPGQPHAEVEAIRQAGPEAAGADLYVTLEPCNHQGRTPACTEAILQAGLRRVVMAATDPNPAVKGGGRERLARAGLEVEAGLLEEEARSLNAAFEKYVKTGIPLVTVKAAVTADGKAAARGGASRWITGERARRYAHRMRKEADAVMVGSGTVAADDPQLTVRGVGMKGAKAPLRVVVDTRLSMDPACRLAQGGEPQVMVAVTREHDHLKAEVLRGRGLEIVETAARDGRVDLEELLSELGRREVASVLVEGGPRLVSSFLKEGLADRLALFVAPRIFADDEAPSWAGGMTTMDPAQGIGFKWTGARRLGEDILLEARVSRW